MHCAGLTLVRVSMLQRIHELWAYRDLLTNLVIRDLKVRYKGSALGFLWSLGNPLLMMAVFTFVFGVLLNSPIDRFPLFILCALLPWNWCNASVAQSVNIILANGHLIKRVYFPREVLPMALVTSMLVNFLLALPVLIVLWALYGGPFTLNVLWLPVIIINEFLLLAGLALALSAINVFFRDTGVIMDVLLLAWFFLTPIFYRVNDVVSTWNGIDMVRLMYIVNPLASIIVSFREVLYYGTAPGWDFTLRSLATSALVFVAGYWIFGRLSARFGEEL
jgi:lipopolysaccharide transport system permease protein